MYMGVFGGGGRRFGGGVSLVPGAPGASSAISPLVVDGA